MSIRARLDAALSRFRLGIRPTDVVLDVGSGNNPHPRADLLCDQFIFDDAERGGQIIADRPVVGGDLERLPFGDQRLDFVIASHVLEHVLDPAKAIAELKRVAPRGYIETPAEFGGKLLDMPFHRWFVRQEDRTLVFTGKPEPMYDPYLNDVAYALWRDGKQLQRLYWDRLDLFLVRYVWDATLEVRVIAPPGGLFSAFEAVHGGLEGLEVVKAPERLTPGMRAKALLRRYYQSGLYGPPRDLAFTKLCACPACHGQLEFAATTATCTGCRLAYPIEQGIPLLLASRVLA
ncbi:MAG: Methyltransferase type 11 [Cyanobacteria bacterium RYN_339]|nr:Methyltransferase type 11 [Cyanobacteria bacterium RYN_339]